MAMHSATTFSLEQGKVGIPSALNSCVIGALAKMSKLCPQTGHLNWFGTAKKWQTIFKMHWNIWFIYSFPLEQGNFIQRFSSSRKILCNSGASQWTGTVLIEHGLSQSDTPKMSCVHCTGVKGRGLMKCERSMLLAVCVVRCACDYHFKAQLHNF
jgi:hypothetical protein